MKTVVYILLFFSCSVYVAKGGDEFFRVEEQNKADARDAARVQADYARQQYDRKQAEIRADQQRAAQQEKKAMQERAEANRAAAIDAKIAQDKADARAKTANEERLQDKARAQSQEDEEREYIKQQSAEKIEQEETVTQRLKAKADLETAIANDRMKSIAADTAIARKKETTEIDVIQSGADVDRTVAKGVATNLSGIGNEELYKFLVVISLIILVILSVLITWRYYIRQKLSKNLSSPEIEDTSLKNSVEEEKSEEKTNKKVL
ncbi:MAG: hypothetical protein WCP01_05550 [Methylococcaceae bacterium]